MSNKKVAVLLTSDFEDSEVSEPVKALREAGFTVHILAPHAGKTYVGKQGEHSVRADVAIDEAKESDYDCLLLPGGDAPETLRGCQAAISMVSQFMAKDKAVAAICHGPQLLISARALKGRKATSVSSIGIDVKNAGADFHDTEVVVDRNLVTSRTPDDMEAFVEKMLEVFSGNVPVTR